MHRKTADALEALDRMIRFGEVGVAGFLPAERDLCRRLNIGRGALAAVLTELAARDLVRRVPGKGIKIALRSDGESWRKFLVVVQGKSLNVMEQFEILRGIASAADDHGAEIVLFFNRNDFVDRRLADRLEDPSVDGVIFMEKFPGRIRETMNSSARPYIVANFEEAANVPAVRVDYRRIGRRAGRHLVESGHRRIGFIGAAEAFIYKEMFAGLKGALAEDDLSVDPALTRFVDPRLTPEQRRDEVRELLRSAPRPCAFFAGRDHWAKLIFDVCGELGRSIPRDVSVIGNDNVSWSDAEKSGLTSFTQPAFATGHAALTALCRAKDAGEPVSTQLLMGEFIGRTSVAKI